MKAFDSPGVHMLGFEITGPRAEAAVGSHTLQVLAQPGPPLAFSWVICSVPFIVIVALLIIGCRRVRPGRRLLPATA